MKQHGKDMTHRTALRKDVVNEYVTRIVDKAYDLVMKVDCKGERNRKEMYQEIFKAVKFYEIFPINSSGSETDLQCKEQVS